MALRSFKEWKQLNEAKGMRNNQPPRRNEVEEMRRTGKLKVKVRQAKDREPTGRPASACQIKGDERRYSRLKFKRGEYDRG